MNSQIENNFKYHTPMKYEEAIKAIKNNYPPENYTMLRESLDLAIKVLQEKADDDDLVTSMNLGVIDLELSE